MMDVKLDTKETFTVIKPQESYLAENMAEELAKLLHSIQMKENPHVVIDLQQVEKMDESIIETFTGHYAQYLEKGHSFILCCLQPKVIELMKALDVYDTLNITPTESEAWDMIHMEAIERELLNGENEDAC